MACGFDWMSVLPSLVNVDVSDTSTARHLPAKRSHQTHNGMLTSRICVESRVLTKCCYARCERQALVHGTSSIVLGWLPEVDTGQSCKVHRRFGIHSQHSNSSCRRLSYALQRQFWTNQGFLLSHASIRDSMVHSPESSVRGVKECQVVGINSYIAIYEFDSGFGSVQFFLEGLGWFVENVAEKDMSPCVVEKADEVGANAYGSLRED